MDEKRVFSEQEAADLIVAAARMQESEGDGSNYAAGVSWAQMQKMAQDVGVDPEYLRKALAGGGEARAIQKRKAFLGMPVSEEFERVVDAEIPPENFDVIASEFYGSGTASSTHAGGFGGPGVIGRMMKGMYSEGIMSGPMEVSSRHGRTRIRAKASNAIAAWGLWLPLMVMISMFGIFIPALRAPEMLTWTIPAVGAVGVGMWVALGAAVAQAKERLKARMGRIADAILDEAEMLRRNLGSVTESHDQNEPDELRETLREDK